MLEKRRDRGKKEGGTERERERERSFDLFHC
jgi:hypothetical protein